MHDNYETLLIDSPEPQLLRVVLNRPDAANALNTQMGCDLLDVFSSIVLDAGDTRCIVLTGVGGKAFCAGGDLKERNGMTDDAWRSQHAIFEQAFYAIMDCPVPVIAAVNGAAYGGGCEMALACDFAYAVPGARFALTEVTLGIMPGCGGTQNLPRAAGLRRAKEVLLTGTPFTAQDALDWGVINRICEPAALMPSAIDTARRISANAPLAVRQAKRSMNAGIETDLKSGLAFEVEAYNRLVPTEDRAEGMRSFNEKRKPKFSGR